MNKVPDDLHCEGRPLTAPSQIMLNPEGAQL
jgi:hypothetical protein